MFDFYLGVCFFHAISSNNQQTEVFDHDRGTNGTFQLHVEGDQNIFEVIKICQKWTNYTNFYMTCTKIKIFHRCVKNARRWYIVCSKPSSFVAISKKYLLPYLAYFFLTGKLYEPFYVIIFHTRKSSLPMRIKYYIIYFLSKKIFPHL